MKTWSETELEGCDDHLALASSFTNATETYKMLSVGWVDRNRRYFVSATGSSNPDAEQVRVRWRKREGRSPQERKVIQMPHAVQDYYKCASAIDRHNRIIQDDLAIVNSC